jgi:hypothetical protein
MLFPMRTPAASVSARIVPILCGGFLVFAHAGSVLCQTEDIPGLSVKVAIFAGKVDNNKNYVEPGMQSGVQVHHGPVYLWTKLTGTEETAAALQALGKSFPIYHEWTYIGPLGNEADVPEDIGHDELIAIGRIKDLSLLASQAESEGEFYWRTWSGKKFIHYGRYQVRVLYGKSRPLRCASQDCTYYFDFLP